MKKTIFLCLLIPIALLAGCCGGGGGSTVRGCGVIMESIASKAAPKAAAWIPPYLKEVDPSDLALGGVTAGPDANLERMPPSPLDVTQYPSFFYLNWDKNDGADQYQVLYGGAVVWDSNNTHSGDPIYDANKPQAYLDLDDELKDKVIAVGNYSFQVVSLNGGSEIQRYPAVTLSLGMVLTEFPAVSYANTLSQRINWTLVSGAGGYRVQIYTGDWSDRLETSGSTLLSATTTFYNLTTSTYTNTVYYRCMVDAHALNGGMTVEIVRAIDGFTFTTP